MSLGPENRAVFPQSEGFKIPDTENPIEYGANALRTYLADLTTSKLEGTFPKNGGYHIPDYNLVYVSIDEEPGRGRIYPKAETLITLEPDGRISTGRVERTVLSDRNYLDFDSANLRPATDLEVIEYAPSLLDSLIYQVGDELIKQTGEETARTALAFLEQRTQMREKVREIVRETVLDADFEDIDEFTITELNLEEYLEAETAQIEQARLALDLYSERHSILAKIAESAATGRLPVLRNELAQLLERAKSTGLFPTENMPGQRKITEGITLAEFRIGRPLYEGYRGLSTSHGAKNGPFFYLVATPDNRVVEIDKFTDVPARECTKHLVGDARAIAGSIVGMTVETAFPEFTY